MALLQPPQACSWAVALLVALATASLLSTVGATGSDDSSDDSSDEYVRCTTFEQCCEMWGEDSKRCARGPCSEEIIMHKFFSLSMPLQSVGFWEVVFTIYSMMPYLALITIIVEALWRSRCYTRVLAIVVPIVCTVLNTVILVRVLGDCDECPRPAGSCLTSNGLPSGHATNAIALGLWIVLEALVGVGVRRRQWSLGRRALVVAAAVLVFAPVPYSRYYLGDHTALQVSVGAADGVVLAVFFFFFFRSKAMHFLVDKFAQLMARIKLPLTDDFYAPKSSAETFHATDDSTIAEESSESEHVEPSTPKLNDKEPQTAYRQV